MAFPVDLLKRVPPSVPIIGPLGTVIAVAPALAQKGRQVAQDAAKSATEVTLGSVYSMGQAQGSATATGSNIAAIAKWSAIGGLGIVAGLIILKGMETAREVFD